MKDIIDPEPSGGDALRNIVEDTIGGSQMLVTLPIDDPADGLRHLAAYNK